MTSNFLSVARFLCCDISKIFRKNPNNFQLSDTKIVLTGGQLHPNLVTEYSGIDNGWQVFIPTIISASIIIIIIIITITINIVITKTRIYPKTSKNPVIRGSG